MSRKVVSVHDWTDEQGAAHRTVRYTDAEADDRLAAYIKSVVDRAPELTDHQVDELRSLMGPITGPATETDLARVPRAVVQGPRVHEEDTVVDKAVYFIQSGGPAGEIKIGFSGNPQGRLKVLQTGSPYPLKILATVPGGKALETELHDRFAADWIFGEWFRPSEALLAYIREIGTSR